MNFRNLFILILAFSFSTSSVFAETLLATTDTDSSKVDLLWQGVGYVPPFYKGKSLWGKQGQIIFFAVPHVNSASPSSLTYRWSKDGVVLGSASGVGKSSLTLADSIISKPVEIKVDIVSSQNNPLGSNSVRINPEAPQVLIYENNPLYGILFNNEIEGMYTPRDKEFSFIALPLFFSTYSNMAKNIKYAWSVAEGTIQSGPLVTYRVPETESGTSQVTLNAKREDKLLQNATRSFTVQFGNQPSI